MTEHDDETLFLQLVAQTAVNITDHMIASKVKPDVAAQCVCSMMGKAFESGGKSARALRELIADAKRKGLRREP
jgi:hypothetical protein